MSATTAHQIAATWRSRCDRDRALPLRRAVAIVEQALASGADVGAALAAALAEAREADHRRNEYVARLALQYRATAAATHRAESRDVPPFADVWDLERWLTTTSRRRRAA